MAQRLWIAALARTFCVLAVSYAQQADSPASREPLTNTTQPTATLRNRGIGGAIRLYRIDGKGPEELGYKAWNGSFNSSRNGKFEIALAAGEHTIAVEFVNFRQSVNVGAILITVASQRVQTGRINVTFTVAAGRSYLADAVMDKNTHQWSYTVVDVTDKQHPQPLPFVATVVKSPIHDAAAAGDVNAVAALLRSHPDLVSSDLTGVTPLIRAVAKGHTDVVKLLLANRADVDARNNGGMTSLHIASFAGNAEMAALLLANGADVNAKDGHGWTPLRFARRKDVAQVLREHGGHK